MHALTEPRVLNYICKHSGILTLAKGASEHSARRKTEKDAKRRNPEKIENRPRQRCQSFKSSGKASRVLLRTTKLKYQVTQWENQTIAKKLTVFQKSVILQKD